MRKGSEASKNISRIDGLGCWAGTNRAETRRPSIAHAVAPARPPPRSRTVSRILFSEETRTGLKDAPSLHHRGFPSVVVSAKFLRQGGKLENEHRPALRASAPWFAPPGKAMRNRPPPDQPSSESPWRRSVRLLAGLPPRAGSRGRIRPRAVCSNGHRAGLRSSNLLVFNALLTSVTPEVATRALSSRSPKLQEPNPKEEFFQASVRANRPVGLALGFGNWFLVLPSEARRLRHASL